MPPITTVASGLCTSAPVPVFSAMGRKPKLATSAIINTGRSFVNVPFTMASSIPIPCARKSRMHDTITRPVSTATPERVMKLIPAEMDSGISRSQARRPDGDESRSDPDPTKTPDHCEIRCCRSNARHAKTWPEPKASAQ